MSTTHTTTSDNAEIIAAAINAAKKRKGQERGAFPRFMVKDDVENFSTDSRHRLEKYLSGYRYGEACHIFRNNGYGATISFDKP